MSYIDLYKKRLGMSGGSVEDAYVNNTQRYIDNTFKKSPNLKKAIHLNEEIYVRVLSSKKTNGLSKKKDDYRKIIFQDLKYISNIGDYIQFDNMYWLIIDKDDNLKNSVTVEKCNSFLKWQDKYGNIYKYPCVSVQDTFYNTGVNITKPMTLGDGKLTIWVNYNKNTSKIRRDKRFIIGNHSYKVTNDDITTSVLNDVGIMALVMEETEEIHGDDFENQLANNSIEPLQIIIEGKDLIKINDSIKLNSIVRRGNEVIKEDVVWTSSDNNIVKVDDNGIITGVNKGQCEITCQLRNNPNISDKITIEVKEDIQNNITYEFTTDFDYSPFEVPKGMGQTITIHKYNNGNEVEGNFKFELDLKGVKEKDIEFKIINNSIYIKNLNISKKTLIELIAIDIDNNEIIKKELILKGLF